MHNQNIPLPKVVEDLFRNGFPQCAMDFVFNLFGDQHVPDNAVALYFNP